MNGINNCVQRRFDNVIKKDINEQRVDDENSKKSGDIGKMVTKGLRNMHVALPSMSIHN